MSHTVFVVEDHDLILKVYTEIIESIESLTVCGTARSSKEALEKLPSAQPDITLMDISLPGMNGIDLLRLLKENDPTVKVLVISGQDERVYARLALAAGADGYVTKLGLLNSFEDAIMTVLNGGLFLNDGIEALLRQQDPDLLEDAREKRRNGQQ